MWPLFAPLGFRQTLDVNLLRIREIGLFKFEQGSHGIAVGSCLGRVEVNVVK